MCVCVGGDHTHTSQLGALLKKGFLCIFPENNDFFNTFGLENTPPLEGPLLTPLSVANGSMGVQHILWVINEHCLEFTQFSSTNIAVRVVPDLRYLVGNFTPDSTAQIY